MTEKPIPVLVDTDIGTDVDDLLALLTILGSPELELVGVTTTYGDTVLRARIVKQVCDWAGIDVPIGAGTGTPLSGRDVWLAGHEGLLIDGASPAARFHPLPAATVIGDAVRVESGELCVVAIGPLTNVAAALDHGSGTRIRRMVVMGGDFAERSSPEHNFVSDADAAHRVMQSRTAIRVVGVDQTRRVRLYRDELLDITAGSSPLHTFVQREAERWMEFNAEPFVLLHDPVTVAMLIDPRAFTFARGTVEVQERGAVEGVSSFRPTDRGGTEVVRSIDADRLRSLLRQRISDGLAT